jgi:hypothetical protein
MTNLEIKNSLNDENKRLLDDIENFISVRFEVWDKDFYAGKISKSEGCGVVYCKPDLHQAKIAHELLHIKTGYSLGDDNVMLGMAHKSGNPIVRMIITDDLCEGLLNQAEHYLFFEEYLNMGYNATDFFENLRLQTEAEQWKEAIIKHGIGNNGTYTTTEVYSYLAVLILFLLYPVKRQYAHQYKKVSKAVPELSIAMDRFEVELRAIRIDSQDKGRMQAAYEALAGDIIRWVNNSKIIPS